MAGGARPEVAGSDSESIRSTGDGTGRPAPFSAPWPRPVASDARSPADPMMQLVQCVEDLKWQAMSWCASGSSAAAAMYRARMTLMKPRGAPRTRCLDLLTHLIIGTAGPKGKRQGN